MKKTSYILIYFFICSNISFGNTETKSLCKGKPWPYDYIDIPKDELLVILKNEPRKTVIKYLFSELYLANKKSFTIPILHYLATTEKSAPLRGFYKTIGFLGTNKNIGPMQAMELWPKRVHIPSIKNKKQLCDLFLKSHNDKKSHEK